MSGGGHWAFPAFFPVSRWIPGVLHEPPPPATQTRRWAVSRSAAISAFLLVLAGAAAVGHWWPHQTQLPDNLQGRWTTTAPSFAGRELIIGSRTLGFRVDAEEPEQIYPVTARRITERGSAQDVRIEYQAPEGRSVIALSLSPNGIRLSTRSEALWTRAGSTPAGGVEKLRFTPIHTRHWE